MKKSIALALILAVMFALTSAVSETSFELGGKQIIMTSATLHEELHINNFINIDDELLVCIEGEGVYFLGEPEKVMSVDCKIVTDGEEIQHNMSVHNENENWMKYYFPVTEMPDEIVFFPAAGGDESVSVNPGDEEAGEEESIESLMSGLLQGGNGGDAQEALPDPAFLPWKGGDLWATNAYLNDDGHTEVSFAFADGTGISLEKLQEAVGEFHLRDENDKMFDGEGFTFAISDMGEDGNVSAFSVYFGTEALETATLRVEMENKGEFAILKLGEFLGR